MNFRIENDVLIIEVPNTSTETIAKRLNELYFNMKDKDAVLDLQEYKKISLEDLIELLQISNRHRKDKNSFVIVNEHISIDEVPDELVVVPTLQEAYDIIEMEMIERDLGF